MVIDLKKYFLSDDLSDTVEYDLDLSEVEVNGVKPFLEPVKVRAVFHSFAGSVDLGAHLHYTVTMPCDRCNEETVQEKIVRFSHTLVRELNEEEDDDDYILVPGERLDLDELLTEDVLLEMPSKFLCSPDCRGLCPSCGFNLNLGDCSCEKEQTDSRLEILKKLLQDSSETK